MTAPSSAVPPGRARLLREVEHGLRSGPGRPTVLRGDPGIGKTELLRELGRRADRDTLVLAVTGVETEAVLPHAALHRLLAPLLDAVDALPRDPRDALLGAFGLAPGVRRDDDRFRVAEAVHALLDGVDGSVLLVVDDAHWIDTDTLAVLETLRQRAAPERLRLLAATRWGAGPPFDDVGVVDVEPLAPDEAMALLDHHWPGLPTETRRDVLRAAAGNPLALVDLPAAMTDEGAAPSRAPDLTPTVPLPRRLARAVGWHGRGLPPTTAAALLVAAANTGRSVDEALRATSTLLGRPVGADDLDAARSASLIRLEGDDLHFRHPLVRCGVLGAASAPARRAAHRALAALLADDPDRRAWHLSEVLTTDETVAADLEAAAGRAYRSGAPETALVLWGRAADRSPGTASAARRAVRGAEIAALVGDHVTGARLLSRVSSEASPEEAAGSAWLRPVISHEHWESMSWSAEQVAAFVAGVRRSAAAGRADLALRMLDRLARSPGPDLRRAALHAAREIAGAHPDEPARLLIAGMDPGSGPAVRAEARRLVRSGRLEPEQARVCAAAAARADDTDLGADVLPGIARSLLARGRRVAAGRALTSLSWSHLRRGDLRDAEAVARRAVDLTRESHDHAWTWGAGLAQAWIDGIRPGPVDPRTRIDALHAELPAGTFGYRTAALQAVVVAAGDLAAGRYAECAERLEDVLGGDTPLRRWGAADLVEAYVRLGEPDRARPVLAALQDAEDPPPALVDALAFAEALLAPPATRDGAVARALDTAPIANRFLRARLALISGMQLRRARRVRDARRRLTEAAALFAAGGPTRFDAEVDRELAACGGAGGAGEARRAVGTGGPTLTSQELHVALLARDGLSNRQISERLAISPRTVGTHLHRVFGKLDIGGRTELGSRELLRAVRGA